MTSLHLLAAAMYLAQLAIVYVCWEPEARAPRFHPGLFAIRFALLAAGLVVWALVVPPAPLPPMLAVGQILGWIALPAGLGDWMAYGIHRYLDWRQAGAARQLGQAADRAAQEARHAR